MRKLFVAACCLLLAGCAAPGRLSGSAGPGPMESDGQTYVGPSGADFQPSQAREPVTSTCTIKNGAATCF